MTQIARTPKQIGEIVRRRRQTLKQTQVQMGKQVRLRQATISKLETGEPGTRLSTLFDVLTALDLELVIRSRSKSSSHDIEENF
ncbi:MAG: helix-turn-helix domain-containing protein [Burkholderiales bacterium]|jgi:HTH-type transcriptional regulator/antitoxin HipB|nr:helix-turn-helix domain-containing protein [Burkholderiales bacterium]